jgi:FkbM family methyltransferase
VGKFGSRSSLKKRFLHSLAKHVFFRDEWENLGDAREFIHSYLECKDQEKWIIAPLPDGSLVYIDLMDCGVSRNILFGDHERTETELIRSYLSEGSVFIDIGANIGWYTIQTARWVGRAGNVFSFEPRPSTFEHLTKSIKINGLDNITAYKIALSDEKGTAMLMTPEGHKNPGSSYLGNGDGIPVSLAKLDDIIPPLKRLDLIKMDVEGWEPNVIKGAKQTIRKFKPTILSEISPWMLRERSGISDREYISLIKSLGYDCQNIENREFIDSCGNVDVTNVIFIPKT